MEPSIRSIAAVEQMVDLSSRPSDEPHPIVKEEAMDSDYDTQQEPASEFAINPDYAQLQPMDVLRNVLFPNQEMPTFNGKIDELERIFNTPTSSPLTTRPFTCQFCSKTFRTRENLQTHERIHLKIRPYECEFCGKGFTQKAHLDAHRRTHTNERPFKCDICGKGFKQGGQRDVHKKTHTGDKPFGCHLCQERFKQKSHLTKHLNNVHKVVWGLEGPVSPQSDMKPTVSVVPFSAPKMKTPEPMEDHVSPPKSVFPEVSFSSLIPSPSPTAQAISQQVPQSKEDVPQPPTATATATVSLTSTSCSTPTSIPTPEHLRCHFCLRNFRQPQDFIEHVQLHKGPNPYECILCGLKFSQSFELMNHRQSCDFMCL